MARIVTFDEWVDLFRAWQQDIGLDRSVIGDFPFAPKFGELASEEIEFGAYAGERKWETVLKIPDQRIRDALLNYLIVQGDTEFASVEQQRHLFVTAPSEYDRRALARIMAEEMRHGWQMSYVLVTYFGSSGRVEAEKLLQRRAFKRNRLLGAFNEEVRDWLDFFVYTEFQDRDGKYQLTMFRRSAFAPLARSIPPMLKEEAFHLGTGHNGLKRVVKAGKLPTALIQKYFNKWAPACYDLFGTDGSSSAHWAYTWGLKGRYHEGAAQEPPDLDHLNEAARALYVQELGELLADLNHHIPAGQPPLHLPDPKFRRRIGGHAQQPYAVDGILLSPDAYEKHLQEVLPTVEDVKVMDALCKEPDWIEARAVKP
ncbi:MAG: phenylacetate-CoA oxygenase subunit PaaI [Nitrospinae bacterium]|nr:phenylacetate-CoA oxygenase subunit PaaI [Nitrospinota bacterium]